MKKRKVLLVIIFILSVGIATAALVTMIQTGKKPTGPEQVIASGPIVYVECKNIERNLNDFLNSELVKGLKAIDFINVARQVGVPEKEIALYQGIAEQLQSENNRRIFFTLFGEQTAIAAYRIKQADGEKAMLMDRAASVVVVTRLKPGAQLIEALTGMLAKFNPEI
ncbi:MAG TPA: hypothetical protein VLJ10_05435, partial [Candidatus Bathyarchaeia archaeon]|nr:hypothetical protein [Candidatus Bathyarchaeia archaeon]